MTYEDYLDGQRSISQDIKDLLERMTALDKKRLTVAHKMECSLNEEYYDYLDKPVTITFSDGGYLIGFLAGFEGLISTQDYPLHFVPIMYPVMPEGKRGKRKIRVSQAGDYRNITSIEYYQIIPEE